MEAPDDVLVVAKAQAVVLLPTVTQEAQTLTAKLRVLGYLSRIIEACEPKRSFIRQEALSPSLPTEATQ